MKKAYSFCLEIPKPKVNVSRKRINLIKSKLTHSSIANTITHTKASSQNNSIVISDECPLLSEYHNVRLGTRSASQSPSAGAEANFNQFNLKKKKKPKIPPIKSLIPKRTYSKELIDKVRKIQKDKYGLKLIKERYENMKTDFENKIKSRYEEIEVMKKEKKLFKEFFNTSIIQHIKQLNSLVIKEKIQLKDICSSVVDHKAQLGEIEKKIDAKRLELFTLMKWFNLQADLK